MMHVASDPAGPDPIVRFAAGVRGLCFAALLVAGVLALGAAAFADTGVVAAEVVRVDFPIVIDALGTARADESVEIRAATAERIVEIGFEEGERVEAGHMLVRLESSEARADVAAARATLAESESQLRRARELYETRALSASELDQRRTRRDADRAALDAAKARLANTTVRAPFAGEVGLRRVSLGSFVDTSTVITTLDDTDPIELDFAVPETVISQIEVGMPISARSAAWPDRVFDGEVASLDTRVDPVSRTLTVRGRLPNEAGRLRPGMFLSVEIVRAGPLALVVPEQALVPERSRQFVWVIGEGDEVERREVRVGRRRPGQVELLDGVQVGEWVVVEGTQKMRPGMAVEIVRRIEPSGAGDAVVGAQAADGAP